MLGYAGWMVSDAAELARRIASNIDRLRVEADLTTSELIEESGMSRSAFYSRLRNETSWTVDSLAELAAIFAVDPVELLAGSNDVAGPPAATDLSADVLVNGPVLARRIALLRGASDGPGRTAELLHQISANGIAVTDDMWESLINSGGRVRVNRLLIDAIAQYFDVAPNFLTAPAADPVADLHEAQLELRSTLRETGGQIGMRSLGDVPADALRAIARSLRP